MDSHKPGEPWERVRVCDVCGYANVIEGVVGYGIKVC